MKTQWLWVLIGVLLFGCGAPNTPANNGPVMESTPTETGVSTAQRQTSSLASPIAETISPTSKITTLPTPTMTVLSSTIEPVSPLPTPTLSTVTQKDTRLTGEAVIIYRRSGGFAGISEQWTVFPNGRITANNGKELQVTGARVEQLLNDIEALGFFELTGMYMPLDTCCDRFTYELTVRSGDKINTVTTIDAAPNAPPELTQVIDEINRMLAEVQADN